MLEPSAFFLGYFAALLYSKIVEIPLESSEVSSCECHFVRPVMTEAKLTEVGSETGVTSFRTCSGLQLNADFDSLIVSRSASLAKLSFFKVLYMTGTPMEIEVGIFRCWPMSRAAEFCNLVFHVVS
ncbi:hypothetical protein R3P38DRAFT_464696 [Favolaschia claudopus]|uniref:Secreted protein n=1 Tax=Favolaschia claudopus TaxID=2862362 RepID=A0AAV9ZFB8_9AGAR